MRGAKDHHKEHGGNIMQPNSGTQKVQHREYHQRHRDKKKRTPEQGDLPPTHKIAEPHGIGQKQEQRGKEKPYAPRLDRFPAHR